MSSEKNCQKWLEETMASIIETLDVTDARYELEEFNDTFASIMHYVTLKYKNRDGKDAELAMLLKKAKQTEAEIRQIFKLERQFHNEILFYQKYTRPADNFPRCFYINEQPLNEIIVLENVCKSGYRSCPHMYDPPLEFTFAAVRELARFHGRGYVMKELHPEKFSDILGQIQRIRYYPECMIRPYLKIMAPQAVDYLRRQDYDSVFCDKMEALFANAFEDLVMKLVQPLEPLSTLCHGDFLISNMLFKPENSGKYRAMIIDMGLIMLATPVVDLSTFLCLHCTSETLRKSFPEIMWAYHDVLREYLQEAGIWDADKYSYDVFLENYVQGGFFGFLIASFFSAIIMGRCSDFQPGQLAIMDPIEFKNTCTKGGGDKVSKILADKLLYLKDLGCLKHLL